MKYKINKLSHKNLLFDMNGYVYHAKFNIELSENEFYQLKNYLISKIKNNKQILSTLKVLNINLNNIIHINENYLPLKVCNLIYKYCDFQLPTKFQSHNIAINIIVKMG